MITSVLESKSTPLSEVFEDIEWFKKKLVRDPNNEMLKKQIKLLEDAVIIYRLSRAGIR